jgi:hypothetical protein
LEKIPTYKSGDKISIEVNLRDDTGIDHITAHFAEVSAGGGSEDTSLVLTGNGGGQQEATITLTGHVGEKTPAGEYKSQELQVSDIRGNHDYYHPDIRFRIETPAKDTQAPKLVSWRFSE